MMVKRDLKADLKLCNEATPGPWEVEDGLADPMVVMGRDDSHYFYVHTEWDAQFIAQAREGWPHAIERALEAEALARKLLDVLGRVIPRYLVGRLELDLDSVLEATVVQGEWKLYGNDDDSGMSYWCTVCNFQLSEDLFYSGYKNGRWIENGVFKYCPNCGAKMKVK
jgi:hypothetical protein